MSDKTEIVVEDVKTQPTEEVVKTENAIPYARFKEVNDRLKESETKLNGLIDSQEVAKRSELEKQGEYKQLLTEAETKIESLSNKAKAWDEYQTNRREALLSKLPEEDRSIYEGLPLDKLEAHTEKLKINNVDVNRSNPSQTKGMTKDDIRSMDMKDKRSNWGAILDKYR
jgi:hypothetical protein